MSPTGAENALAITPATVAGAAFGILAALLAVPAVTAAGILAEL